MAVARIAGRTKRELSWAYLKLQARARGIDPHSLRRVEGYIRNKFAGNRSASPDPNQRPGGYFPGLPSRPVYDSRDFPWTTHLEAAAEGIKAEFLALQASGQFIAHPQKRMVAVEGNWDTYYFFSDGARFDEHCAACPITSGTLQKLPGAALAGRAFFSLMSPGTHLRAHCGATNIRLRCHLGLIVPDTALMRVVDDRVRWKEGRCIVFDDSYEHEVWNPDAERAVLLVDVWHPDLTEEERWALQQLSAWSGRSRVYRRDMARA